MVSFQNSRISVKVAPFQMRSPDSQNTTASDVVGGREVWERGKREIWDLEGSQLTFMNKLLGDKLRRHICDQFLRSLNFLCKYEKEICLWVMHVMHLNICMFVILICGRHLPLCLTDKEDMCSSTRVWCASNTIILILIIDNSRHGEFLKCNDPGNMESINMPSV